MAADATATAHVADNGALRRSLTATYPNGVWRNDYATASGGPPLLFKPETGTCAANKRSNDGGACLDTTSGDGNSFYAVFEGSGVDARQFGFASDGTGRANKTALQNAIDATWRLASAGSVVRVPIAATVDASVYLPPGLRLVCGGINAPLTRGTVGPLFVTVDAPGHTYAHTVINGDKLEDCTIDNNGLAGTGLVLHQASGWQLVNTSFRNTRPGAQFTIAGISDGVMTVAAIRQGKINPGDMVLCAGCGWVSAPTSADTTLGDKLLHFAALPAGVAVGDIVADRAGAGAGSIPTAHSTYITAIDPATESVTISEAATGSGVHPGDVIAFSGNTYQTVTAQLTGTPGGIGSYRLSGRVDGVKSEQAATATPWRWTGGPSPAACHRPNAEYPVCNTQFPSADVSLLGGVFNGEWHGGFLGGTYTVSTGGCATSSAIGLLLDSVQSDGDGRPNHNVFTNLYDLCAGIGLALDSGADNTFISLDHQYDGIAELFGTGAETAARNIVIQPYFEGNAIAAVFGPLAWDNAIWGTGSLSDVKTPYLQDLGVGNSLIRPPQWALAANAPLLWQNGSNGAADTGLSRDRAGTIAFGNGRVGDHSGTIELAAVSLPQTAFLPTITCGSGAVGLYSRQKGYYTQVGRTTTVSIQVKAAIGSCDGAVAVHLPQPSRGDLAQTLQAVDETSFSVLFNATSGDKLLLYGAGGRSPVGSDEFVITGSYQN